MQYHYVVGFDTENKRWWIESDPWAYFPDGNVWSDKQADEYGHGWFIPEDGTPEEEFDYTLSKTLGYIVDTWPVPDIPVPNQISLFDDSPV